MTLSHRMVALLLSVLLATLPTARVSAQEPLLTDSDKKLLLVAGIAAVGGLIFIMINNSMSRRSQERARNAPPNRMELAYDETTGRLADHVEWNLQSSSCPGQWSLAANVESGSLPAGLSLERDGTISGEAQQSGRWSAQIRVSNLSCTARDGQRRTYADQVLRVQFTIRD